MIGKNLQDNLDIKVNSKKMEKLKYDFPEFFTKEGDFKLDSFKDFLKEEEVELTKEAYELNFLGKSYAKYQSSLNTETYISPDLERNEKPENKDSENVYIVGDNIDALKHLLGSYSGKIKCIYIDPPYNTGSDGFVYSDNFKFTADDLADKIGITEEEADRILNLEGKSSHAAWLTFMYPRLLLARDLLADDGVIFISIDENEIHNLMCISNEIFDENNTDVLVWRKNGKQSNTKKITRFKNTHEYILAIYRDKQKVTLSKMKLLPNWITTSNPDDDPRGDWMSGNISNEESKSNENSENYYTVVTPGGKIITREWYISKDEFNKLNNDVLINSKGVKVCRIYYGKDGVSIPRIKRFVNEEQEFYFDSIIDGMGTFTDARDEVGIILGSKDYFDTPKPSKIIKELVRVSTNQDSLILDFFSGSATTADAVMQLNAEDGGNRKYILVQLPETIKKDKPAYKVGYRTVDEIGRDRIEKAAAKIKDETKADIDYGYKLFYLEKPSEKTLLDLEEFKPEIKLVSDDMISVFDNKHASGKENILATWLNEDGYGLTKEAIDYKLENYTAQLIEKTLYIIDEGLESDDVMILIKKIEDDSLDITRLVIYSYSVKFSVLNELRKNIKVLKNNKNVTLIERF